MENGYINYTFLAFRLYFHKIYFDSVFHYICCVSLEKALHTLSVDFISPIYSML